MKVKITQDARRWITLEQAPKAREMIRDFKENEEAHAEIGYAQMAVNCIGNAVKDCYNTCGEVLRAEAEISGNRRIYNFYSDESGTLDVWITFTARTTYGFIEGGAYLSDIWQIGRSEEEDKELAGYMYYRLFEEVKR